VWLAGQDLPVLPEAELQRIRGRRAAYVSQGAGNALNPVLTVGEQVAEPMLIHLGLKKSAAFKKVAGLLEQMGISGAEKWLCAYPHQYSGGMKQRALVAMGVSSSYLNK
jgi:peptide/nickel transport system ATP-binding protein